MSSEGSGRDGGGSYGRGKSRQAGPGGRDRRGKAQGARSNGGGARGSRREGGGFHSGDGGKGGGPFGNVSNIYDPHPGQPARVDARVAAAGDLIRSLKGLRISGPEHPVRPGYGTAGRAIIVRANFFPVNVSKDVFYEYSVEISPEPKSQKARVKRRILDLFERSAAGQPYQNFIAHDGAQRLVSARLLPQPLSGSVRYFEDGDNGPSANADQYTVAVKFTKELSTEPLRRYLEGHRDRTNELVDPIISAMNLILQRQAAQTGYRFGKNRYFFSDEERRQLGPRLWALMGFFSSVRPVHKQLMVNVNVCMTAFHEPGNLADAMKSFDRGSLGATPQEYMVKVKVSTRHLGYKRIKTIRKISGNQVAGRQMFNCEEFGGRISVKDYYRRKYNINIKHDDIPVVDVGSAGKPTYLPAELCTIEPGEPHLGRLSPNETSEMLKHASRRPAVNADLIVNRGMERLGLSPSTSILDEFGINVSKEMTAIPARELSPPDVIYRKSKARITNRRWDIAKLQFFRGAKMPNWKVLVVQDAQSPLTGPEDSKLTALLKDFARKCQQSGMVVEDEPPQIIFTPLLPRPQSRERDRALSIVEHSMREFGDPKAISMILVLLPRRDDFIYPAIKRIAAVQLGVHTQCMALDVDHRGRDRYLSNVALKVNAKLGGVNHRLDAGAMHWLTQERTMMVGIDVTHPGWGSVPGTPSIAGVVANVEEDFVQFPASLRLQKSRQEGIAELADMMIERLQAFRQHSKVLPDRVLVFRDGVSEGQYDKVLREELRQIFEAFKRVDATNPSYKPKVSIVICGKRHHTRFYATLQDNADPKTGNTRPGTVVDKGVTSIFDFDFYLQAHAGLVGTVRPTHYVVVYDENALAADTMQEGVNAASYLYARATTAVSVIPAVYYADVACEQARYWIHGFWTGVGGGDTRAKGRAGVGKSAREDAEKVYDAAKAMWGNGLHANLKNSMFYQ